MFEKIAKDPQFWEKVRSDKSYEPLVNRLFELYDEVGIQDDIPSLKFTEYKMFFETGNRMIYEKHYFYRRRRMNCLALLALIYPENEEYIDKLKDTIWSICDEYSWVVPAHIKDYPDIDTHTIDLFASETGYALAEIKYLLGDRFEELLNNRIHKEIETRILTRFINNIQGWEENYANWAAVCAGSVAAAFIYEKPELFALVKPRITLCMEHFLSGYLDDGACLEGIGYWEYGFGFFIWYADMLKDFTDGSDDWFVREKVKEIATFAQKAYLTDKCTVCFSDGVPETKIMLGMSHYLKKIYGDCISPIPMGTCKTDDHCGRWCQHVRCFTFFNPEYANEKFENSAEYHLKDSQWFIKKTPEYSFVIKGGNNAEPHNHNDVGSFIIAKGDKQILADIGCGEYTKQYFRPETRYTILCNTSLGHSVPIINGKEQGTGKEYCGTLNVGSDFVSVDYKNAYDDATLKKLERKIKLEKGHINITESFEFEKDGSYVCRLVSFVKPEMTDEGFSIDEVSISYDKKNWSMKVSEEKHTTHVANNVVSVYLMDFETQTANSISFDVKTDSEI